MSDVISVMFREGSILSDKKYFVSVLFKVSTAVLSNELWIEETIGGLKKKQDRMCLVM